MRAFKKSSLGLGPRSFVIYGCEKIDSNSDLLPFLAGSLGITAKEFLQMRLCGSYGLCWICQN